MKIFEFNNYKAYLNKWIDEQPNRGRGILSKIAKKIGIHTTLLSHTVRGDKNLSLEQAFSICEFIGLNELETDYFVLLVQFERAGNQGLKNKFKRDIIKIQFQSKDLATRIASDINLTDAQKSQFYSSWLYAGTRQLTSIKGYQSRANLIEAFSINTREMNQIIDFLISTGLCKEIHSKIEIGPSKTHLESSSPYVFTHHKNWRIKGFEKHNNLSHDELMYTAPFTISHEDFLFFREKVVQLIEQLVKIAENTKSERLACFNLDLFFVK